MTSVPLYKMFIDGKWVGADSGETFEVINPANERPIARVPKGGKSDVKKAIDAARNAFDKGEWPHMTPAERTAVLWRLADLVEKDAPNIARLESMDVGKTIKYARDSDLPFIVDNLRFFAGAARAMEGKAAYEYADFHAKREHKGMGLSFIRREPIGVVGAIVPWNYPLYIAVWKIAPALAAGNTMVIKPATHTPLTTLRFAELCEKAGVPKGVLNVVTGPGELVGAELASSHKVDMIAMTGDTSTGRKIMEYASSNVKNVHLELGGKAPMVVLQDADVDAAAEGAVVGAFWNTGQDCTAVTRVYVHEKLYDKFTKLVVEKAKKFRIGDPLSPSTDMGPLISERQRERVEDYIASGIKQGAKLVYGGKRPAHMKKGFYIEPTIFTNAPQHSKICQEEIFGPVLTINKFKTVDEAVASANDVMYGLASSVWGSDIRACLEVAKRLDFGTVWINEHGVLVSEMPHGGFKQSGFGKDLSMYSFEAYTRLKHVYVDMTGRARKPWHYVVYGEQ
ncbi:MAG: aminobutyraldehyde dehydrogenase [Candidatus Aenigmatarchaeota archaeon]|nr:MAG: aminobutyraldehyde dehydrogenase [Candidatus Aenigmarchaeota archaeon]